MKARGIMYLAEIARYFNTTPQAVSNWKSRGQIPYHVISKISDSSGIRPIPIAQTGS